MKEQLFLFFVLIYFSDKKKMNSLDIPKLRSSHMDFIKLWFISHNIFVYVQKTSNLSTTKCWHCFCNNPLHAIKKLSNKSNLKNTFTFNGHFDWMLLALSAWLHQINILHMFSSSFWQSNLTLLFLWETPGALSL